MQPLKLQLPSGFVSTGTAVPSILVPFTQAAINELIVSDCLAGESASICTAQRATAICRWLAAKMVEADGLGATTVDPASARATMDVADGDHLATHCRWGA